MGSPKIAAQLDSEREARLALAEQFIPAGARILEVDSALLGGYLPLGCIHRSARREALSARTAAKYDLVVTFRAPQSIAEIDGLLGELARADRPLLICHRNRDPFAFTDLIAAIGRNGYRVETSAPLGDEEMLMRLTPARKINALMPCSVGVLCGNMTFAERLGVSMIKTLLPGEAELHHINFGDLAAARERYDLIVLGAGQGLFHPLFAEDVLEVVRRGRAAIGIFGTQQRDLLPRAAFDRLLDSLDVWFARSRDDVLLYGRGRGNVTYLGDWLFEHFPLGHGRERELLTIHEDALCDLPLDRAIAAIQRHRAVFARALAPLLCALNTADTVAFADDLDAPSGEFRAVLHDIFGRTFPDSEFFQVDRDAVLRYRARVHRNVALMRARIQALLRGKAAAAA